MITVSAVAAASTMSAPANFFYTSSPRFLYSPSPYSFSSPAPARPGTSNSFHPLRFAPLSFIRFSSWSGLKHMGFSQAVSFSKKGRRKNKQGRMVAYASLFGVGAPEALVIGVVALLVFGPKGLAEVARNLGKTLRAFQPTIRELQDVSREFKSTLEREIGLDDFPEQNMYNANRTRPSPPPPSIPLDEGPQSVPDPNTTPPSGQVYSSEEYLKITEEQLKLAKQKKENSETLLSGENLHESEYKPQVEETAAMPPPTKSESD